MKYYVDESLRNFKFWSGGKDTADELTYEQIDEIELYLESIYSEGDVSDTDINDFFWFERELISEILGYRSADAMFSHDLDSWEEHYTTVLKEKFYYEDEDVIEEFVEDETVEGTCDIDLIENFKLWLADQREEEDE